MAGALTAAIAAAFAGGAAPPSTDDYFEYTTLLLPGNGTNGAQNNTFLDASTNNFTITRNGNTTQGTFSPFSQTGWGNYFGGDGNYLSSAYSADFSFSTGEFSIECWANVSDAGRSADANKYGTFVSAGLSGNTSGLWDFSFGIFGGVITEVTFGNSNTAVLTVTSQTITLNQWHHFVVCRSGSTFSFFVDGTRIGTTTYSTAVDMNASGSLRIAALAFFNTYQNWINGYISNLRIIKGSSAYNAASSSITVSTIPLTSPTNTKLLTCQSNRFIDANTQVTAKAITLTGSPRVVAFSPFSPTASWSAATYGGSGYFDGSGDYLTWGPGSSAAFGTSAFCVEMWFYPTGSISSAYLIDARNSGQTNTWSFAFGYSGTTSRIEWANNGTVIANGGTTNVISNTWNHIVYCRSGTGANQASMFINGVRQANVTDSTNYSTSPTTSYIGSRFSSADYITGYLSNIRIVNGSQVYDPTSSSITVPTAPLTAITNTSLLLNYTNAGIYDATSKNDLETVGNAQISTTQSKWGGSSMAFDGTGDWLLIPDQPIQRIGTGNFTVEGWVYRNSSGTYGLIGKGTGTTGWLVSLNSSNQVVFTYGSSTITSTGTVSATTWTHIAVVREGTSTNQTKIYINGTNDGTGTVSTDFNQTNSMYVGADRTGGSAANAYMQDVRVTNYARYTANFTAPTAAFPTL
jgi:hypothetical protein